MSNIEQFGKVTNGKFTLMPDGEVGAVDTAHGVFFGRLGCRPVAVKKYDAQSAANHESSMLKTIARTGIRTVQPVSIIRGEQDRGAFLVTERISGLTSSGSLPLDPHNRAAINSVDLVRDIAGTLGHLNGQGITHGDPQVKNFGIVRGWVDPITERPTIVTYDPEKGGTDEIGHVKSDPYAHDIAQLTQSLAYKGFGGSHLDVAADALEEHVLEPYAKAAVNLGESAVAHAVEHGFDMFVEVHHKLGFTAKHGGHNS